MALHDLLGIAHRIVPCKDTYIRLRAAFTNSALKAYTEYGDALYLHTVFRRHRALGKPVKG